MARAPFLFAIPLLAAAPAACASYEPQPVSAEENLAQIERRADDFGAPTDASLRLDPEFVRVAAHVDAADGLDLAELNAVALRYAPDLLAARCEARVAEAQLSVAGRPANPSLFVGPRLGDGWSGLVLPVALAFEVVLNDVREAERERSEHEYAAARHRIAAVEIETLADVRRRAVRVRALRARLRAIEPLAQLLAEVPARVRARRDAGEEDLLGDAFLVVGIENVLVEAERWTQELVEEEAGLAAFVGLVPGRLVLDLDDLPLATIADAGDGWRRLPSVLAAVEDVRAAEQELRRSFEARTPSLQVGPEFEYDSGDKTTGIGVGAELPIFDDGSATVRAATARRDAARARLDATLLYAASRRDAARARLDTAETTWARRAGLPQLDAEPVIRALERRIGAGEVAPAEAAVLVPALVEALAAGIEIEERRSLARIDVAVAEGAWLLPPDAPADGDTR